MGMPSYLPNCLVETTLAIYTHVDLDDMREALSRTFAANLLAKGLDPGNRGELDLNNLRLRHCYTVTRAA